MNVKAVSFGLIFFVMTMASCKKDDPAPGSETSFTLTSIQSDDRPVGSTISGASLTPEIVASFSAPIDRTTVPTAIVLVSPTENLTLTYTFSHGDSTVTIKPSTALEYLSKYNFQISTALTSVDKKALGGNFDSKVITTFDPADKFPVISDEELLTLTQKQTFKYFWDMAEPTSGMALERKGSGPTVTSGGSGFGIMAIVVGMDRNFITRTEGVERLNKIVTFLETADRFHGAWSHWINGTTGKVIPFSTKDNGGDLVETSFLMQGLLTSRQYLQPTDTVGNNLIRRMTKLYEGVEWDWYRKDGQEVLYWHWSPNYNWDMNFALSGYFEEQITYILAAASPTHGIPKSVYTNGYGRNGAIKTGQKYYGYTLPLGTPSPLFWVQYSYLGMDPHFKDDYADYWEQNVNATLINHAYCAANPKNYVGYSDACWGLTASDNPTGYDAHSPSNDQGVITPTAALSSFPYAPEESMKALKFFYYTLGDKLWGPYGFYDAFDLSDGWVANSYLAIDQGPIVVMIENYRTGLLWNLFMSAPEVQAAKTKLEFN
ncbi:glucoamylase family protein [Chryseolinea soli]|uniref:Beta-glucosidase n=1 Tax=Chryseolinea soli TaxID=2321403 RepID=A0A385SWM4_9BACT|nr:glucoamylase family protein [Chryseolinea soli]AYB33198.1 beta-glucosidase [Chryseolinea soli]